MMVSSRSLLQAVFVLASAISALAAPHQVLLTTIPYMPRIPSAAKHHEVLQARALTEVDPSVLGQVTCLDANENISLHDENVAQLSVCGGMVGSIETCQGSPKRTVGQAGSAKFTVTVLDDDATISISKKHWMQCVRAARAVCSAGSFSATCLGGSSKGDVFFTLESPQNSELRGQDLDFFPAEKR